MLRSLARGVVSMLDRTPFSEISIRGRSKAQRRRPPGINLNIGSGGYRINGFVDLDVPSPSYDNARQGTFVPYDMRRDKIPYEDGVVDNIYCSHVVEHVEDKDVETLLQECSRVLKPSGVLRICCPDAEFLWNVSSFQNDYWWWRHGWFEKRNVGAAEVKQLDYLVREVSTGKLRFFSDASRSVQPEQLPAGDYEQAMRMIVSGNKFDLAQIAYHINYWDFDKLARMASRYKWTKIVRSKYQGSVSQFMTGPEFDRTHPQMSLYVDFVR
jgi:SAM-dependent methyltransferase